MEKRLLLVLLALLGAIAVGLAQDDSYLVYRAYIEKDMESWRQIIDRRRNIENPSKEYMEETINYEYGFVAWSLANLDENRNLAQKYLEYAFEDMEKYEEMDGEESRLSAYKSAFIAYDMKLHPMKAPFIGLKSVKLSKDAVNADGEDFFAYIQRGNVLYYLPVVFGGSKQAAIETYCKAREIMQSDFDNKARHNWLYLNLWLTLADAYKGLRDYAQVKTCYDSVLQIAPDFAWVRDSLYKSLP